MKEEHNIEDLFRSSFDHFEEAPPVAVKNAIDRKLNSRSRSPIWWISGLAIFIVILSTFMYSYLSPSNAASKNTSSEAPILAKKQHFTTRTTNHPSDHSVIDHQLKNDSKAISHRSSDTTMPLVFKGTPVSKKAPVTHQKNTQSSRDLVPRSINMGQDKTSQQKKKTTRKTITPRLKTVTSVDAILAHFQPISLAETIIALKQKEGNSSSTSNNSALLTSEKPIKEEKSIATNTLDETAKNNLNDPKAADTIQDAEPNSLANSTDDGIDPKDSIKNTWLASLYAGPQFGLNTKSNDPLRSLSEKTSFLFSAEVNLSNKEGYGLSSGFSYNKRQETYQYANLSIVDSVYLYTDTIPIYGNPNMPDSITGYQYSDVYGSDTTKTNYTQLNRIQTIGIPLYMTKYFSFKNNWGLMVNAGALFQFYQISFGDGTGMPAPTTNKFGINLVGRFHATYSVGNWMFSAGIATGWEMKQAVVYEGLDRKRYFISPQLGFHYRF